MWNTICSIEMHLGTSFSEGTDMSIGHPMQSFICVGKLHHSELTHHVVCLAVQTMSMSFSSFIRHVVVCFHKQFVDLDDGFCTK